MPELPEIEVYRALAERALHRQVASARVRDPRFTRGAVGPRPLVRALDGVRFSAARRHGKLLVLDIEGRPADAPAARLGLRFGMTGRLIVDGDLGVEHLVYASNRAERAWDRFVVRFVDGGELVVRDPRLLGSVALDPDERALGPDARAVTRAQLARALDGSAVAVKARIMDQRRLAGVGNLMADEILWRASLAPTRRSGSLTPAEVRRLHHHLRATVEDLIDRGGSHLGDMTAQRHLGGRCPRDGAALVRSTVGGRTTWWCARHQH
jgi:formamidopyrimidine-DNA glycosylase